jgi:hypothetical protein
MRSFQTTAASVRALQSQKSVLCRVIDSPTSSVVSHCLTHIHRGRDTRYWELTGKWDLGTAMP